jgi:hypothetical protein
MEFKNGKIQHGGASKAAMSAIREHAATRAGILCYVYVNVNLAGW